MAKKTVAAKKRNVKVDALGQLHVHSSFNNVIVSLANSEGQVISWSSAGKMGFRGSKKNTPYAAQMAAQDCAKVAYDLGTIPVISIIDTYFSSLDAGSMMKAEPSLRSVRCPYSFAGAVITTTMPSTKKSRKRMGATVPNQCPVVSNVMSPLKAYEVTAIVLKTSSVMPYLDIKALKSDLK